MILLYLWVPEQTFKINFKKAISVLLLEIPRLNFNKATASALARLQGIALKIRAKNLGLFSSLFLFYFFLALSAPLPETRRCHERQVCCKIRTGNEHAIMKKNKEGTIRVTEGSPRSTAPAQQGFLNKLSDRNS